MKFPRTFTFAFLAIVSSTAGAQQLGGGGATADVSVVRVFLALLACLVLAVLAILFVRQRLGGRMPSFLPRLAASQPRIRLIEARRISPQADLALVDCDGTEYFLIVSPGGITLLRERPLPVAPKD